MKLLLAILVVGTLPLALAAQEPKPLTPVGFGPFVGGAVGAYSLGGDFQNVDVGVALRGIGGIVWPSGVGLTGLVEGSFHKADGNLTIVTTSLLAGPRFMAPLYGPVAPFLDVRGGGGLWQADVPNRITLENTSVSAVGLGWGINGGVVIAASPKVLIEIYGGLSKYSYGDAGTEGFAFPGTSANATQVNVGVGVNILLSPEKFVR